MHRNRGSVTVSKNWHGRFLRAEPMYSDLSFLPPGEVDARYSQNRRISRRTCQGFRGRVA
ncbi:hypothetical protein FMEAI12_2240002 [Parafrankia sp. Ea1.12]|nr:hypothetical protein FMEAI12_2240002 [Parafrankia sp. Ea1.12]